MYRTEEEIMLRANEVIGRSMGSFDKDNKYLESESKGRIGHTIEEFVFGYKINNDREPDFKHAGIELKSTGYKWVYKGTKVSAKERLVLTMIDFYKDIDDEFYDSHLYKKIDKILLMLYEYEEGKKMSEMVYSKNYLFEFSNISEKDKLIIENDYNFIIEKIKAGKAHELSEGDTIYLGACPKGVNRLDTVAQPNSDIESMKRAFSLKTNYMTSLMRNEIFDEVENRESFIKDLSLLKRKSFTDIVLDTFISYEGKTLTEIDSILGDEVNRYSKNFLSSYAANMMNVSKDNIDNLEEFKKANIEVKTIRLENNDNLKESMSFPAFDFKEIAEENWETSKIRDFFYTTKFLFVVFKRVNGNEYEFVKAFFWNMPEYIIEESIWEVWNKTNNILNNKIELRIKKNRVYNNFPKMSTNYISHVRSHGANRNDTNPLPEQTDFLIKESDGSVDMTPFLNDHKFTKLCFWLGKEYILEIIEKNI